MVAEIQTSIARIDSRFTFFQTPVRFEDVLGRTFLFPSEFSIKSLHAEILFRFRRVPGRAMVEAGDYEIFDNRNASMLLDTENTSLLPGMSIKMAIIVPKVLSHMHRCPMRHCRSALLVQDLGGKTW